MRKFVFVTVKPTLIEQRLEECALSRTVSYVNIYLVWHLGIFNCSWLWQTKYMSWAKSILKMPPTMCNRWNS